MGRSRPNAERGIAPYVGVSDINRERIRDALLEFDDAVTEIEDEWGIDRLPDLVDGELRRKFKAQMQKLNDAIRANDGHEVKRQAQVTLRGYDKLVEAARERGHKPLTGSAYEVELDDGTIICITKTPDEACKVARQRDGVSVYSAEEAARIIHVWQREKVNGMISAAKQAFAGAQVTKINETEVREDELPF